MRFTPNRGAARVSAVWIIVLAVLFLAALAFGFISQSDMAKAQNETARANAKAADAVALVEEQANAKRGVSRAFGFFDQDSADPVSNLDAASKGLEDLKTAFSDLGANVTTYEGAVPRVIAAYGQRGIKIAELQGQIAALQGELTQAQASASQVASEKDSVISTLRAQIADTEQNAASRQDELERRLASANDQNSELDSAARQAAAAAASVKRALEQDLRASATRIKSLSDTTAFAREPHANKPDGEVIATSGELPLGWINIGSDNRLTSGTRFEVRTADVEGRLKGMCEVVRVEAKRAEVAFFDVVDRFNPITKGDVIINKLYDPVGGRNAVLVGRFSGAYTEAELKIFLERMGINVQPKLDLTTHFVIVGSELYNDPETNEPLDEPIQPSDLPVYKDAEAQGCQIVPLQDVRQFFSSDYDA